MSVQDESQFTRIAGAALRELESWLEHADTQALLDIDSTEATLTLSHRNGMQWIVSRHIPTRQLWLSSPISGGTHFPYDRTDWVLADGRSLRAVLASELAPHGVSLPEPA